MSASRRRIIGMCTLAAAVTTALATVSPVARAGPATDGRIAFQRVDFERGSVAIYTIDPDGSDLQQVTHPRPGVATAMAESSPNGKRIAFTRLTDEGEQIFVIRADGTRRTNLSKGHCRPDDCHGEEAPTWSPNGKRIAFARGTDGGIQIYVMRADGTHRHRVTDPPGRSEDWTPSWSPDGSRLVFERWAPRNVSGLFTVRSNGTHLRRITRWRPDDGDPLDWYPDWSPDGRWILFNHANGGAMQQMCLIHPNGSGFRRITHGTAFSWSTGSFSPDGTMITVMRAPGEMSENDVYVMNVDGSGITPVTGGLSTAEAEGLPDWGPGG